MSLLALLAVVPLTPIFDKIPRGQQAPPKAFAEGARLPGKPPPAIKDALGAWQLDYSLDDVNFSDGNAELIVNLILKLEENGTYQMVYAARWGNPPVRGKDAAGITVDEAGSYKLSGDVLILQPDETMQADIEKNKVMRREPIHSEKHVFVIHWESKRIHLVGRCAVYQVDPICKNPDLSNVWFTLKGSVGRRLFGR
jgi:hypothetical protein